jgi:5-formyltetrahydrofolate cyclo-ligase
MRPADSAAINERKRALRRELRLRRAALSPADRAVASEAAARHVLESLPWRERRKMSLFWPLADEIDTQLLLHDLHRLGAEPLLPRMQGKGQPLVFHAWAPELALVPGSFGVMEPSADLPVVVPEIVLAPLLAFDRRGHRLGYGAGFYDRTFDAIVAAGGEPLRVGYCFACQEIAEVPVDETDVPLDAVVTEEGLLPLGRAPVRST